MIIYRGREGVWLRYDWDSQMYVISAHRSAEDATLECTKNGYGQVLFCPFGMELRQAREWYLHDDEILPDVGTEIERHRLREIIRAGIDECNEQRTTKDEGADLLTNKITNEYFKQETT